MKKIITYCLFCSLMISNAELQAQYHHFIQEDAYWQSLEGNGAYYYVYPRGFHFFFKGDTSINNQTYSILNYYDIDIATPSGNHFYSVDSSEVHIFGFFREDTLQEKVYIKSLYHPTEQLFLDFTLNVGDTLSSSSIHWPLVVRDVRYITLIDGSLRLKWSFDYDLFYIEGIGSSQGFFRAMEVGLGWWYTPHCYTKNNIHLYGEDETGLPILHCFDFINTALVPNPINVQIYPNPTQQQLIIERDQEGEALFELYNMIGQRVLATTLQQREETISLAILAAGSYRYVIDHVESGTIVVQPR
ncbi:MAG: T9SS type A sorting domain-containing protein [Aureispira sp.]